MTYGEVKILFVLIISWTCSKYSNHSQGDGRLLGIQESSVLIVLLLISLLTIIVIPTKT